MWNDTRIRFSVPYFNRQSNAVIACGESGLQNNGRYTIQDKNYMNCNRLYELNNEMHCSVMHCKSLWWTCSAIQYWEKRIRRSAWGRSTFLIMQSNTPSTFYFIQRTCSRNCNTKLIHSSVFATNTNVCIWFIQLGPQEAIYMLMPCLLSDAGSTQLRSITLAFSVQVWKPGKSLDRVLTLWDDPAARAECSGKDKDTSSWSPPGWQSRLDCHHHQNHHHHLQKKKIKRAY